MVECIYSIDGNIREIINHICDIYEPLRLALQNQGALRTDFKIILIGINRTSTIGIKIFADIARLVIFKEEPPDELIFKQIFTRAKKL